MVNLAGANVIYAGATPATIRVVAGDVPQKDWIDFTNNVDDPTKLRLAWSINPEGEVNSGGNTGESIKRTTSGTIRFNGEAYQFIKAWCVDDVAAPLNAVEVRIQTDCGAFEKYKISSEQLRWCEGEYVCEFDVTLSQVDPALQCVQRTVISDNHQGWFQEKPRGGKKHPRFSYCNEAKPNAWLIGLWWILSLLAPVLLVLFAIYAVVLVIINVINLIIGFITSVAALLSIGGVDEPEWNAIPEYRLGDFIDIFEQFFVETSGCGREHPAPLIRDYILNVCNKCGLKVDAVTAPIFFAPVWNIDLVTSTGENLRGQPNPYFNACYLNAPVRRGVRRFTNTSVFTGASEDTETFYIPVNAPILALNDFLDEIKKVFNSEWRVKNGKLYFWRKDWFMDGAVLYDFTANSEDRRKILEGVCFEWNERKMFAASQGLYTVDIQDRAADEARSQMNGKGGKALVQYAPEVDNPIYQGLDNREVQVGATRFRHDGAATDYIYDAMQACLAYNLLAPFMPTLFRQIDSWLGEYANYALLLSAETASLPKIIIWDGASYLAAKSTLDTVPLRNSLTTTEPVPTPNPRYNEDVKSWADKYPPQSRVRGSKLLSLTVPNGIYRVQTVSGSLVAQNSARLVNYAMYYNPEYTRTLWDLFHYIDDPRLKPKLNCNFTVKICLTCEDVTKLKLVGDGSRIEIGSKVLLDVPYYSQGKIEEIEVNIDPTDNIGSHITLKGSL